MAAVGDDCYFFCTSTCAKGAACPFRHVEAAKTCKIICQHWQTVGCFRPMCKFRHSDFHIQLNNSGIPCYWESQPVGCSKANCLYKHTKPRPEPKPATAPVNSASSSPKQDSGTQRSPETQDSVVDTFVMPKVKPVIIDPDSEASNSSPVKKGDHASKLTVIQEEKTEMEKTSTVKPETEKKETNADIQVAPKVKKMVPKKKKGVLKQPNSKAPVAKVKKGTGNVKIVKKVPIKRKKEAIANAESPVVPAKKKLKDRLQTKPADTVASVEKNNESDESSEDSDDSIENVKVLSMEEIFRQKALESMMKRRAAEGKPMLPEYNLPRERPATSQKPPAASKVTTVERPVKKAVVKKKPVVKAVKKPAVKKTVVKKPVVKKKVVKVVKKLPPPPPEPESENEEEDEEEEEAAAVDVIEEESEEEEEEDSSSSGEISDSSSSDASSESEEEETEVRRVVINLEAEKSARDKAKASLLKKRLGSSPVVAASSRTIKKRKVISDHQDEEDVGRPKKQKQPQLSIKERLGVRVGGRPPAPPASTTAGLKRAGDLRLVSAHGKAKTSSEEDDDDDEETSDGGVMCVKVKSLDEFKGNNSPVKDRLGLAVTPMEEEHNIGRKILLTDDSNSPKKVRRRPWGAAKPTKAVRQEEEEVEEDRRQVSASSPLDALPPTTTTESEPDAPESPFEAMRQRAFLRKTLQSQDLQQPSEAPPGEDVVSEEETEIRGGKRKKHKHKHKRKKSKKERQIYVPPSRKVSGLDEEDMIELDMKPPSPPMKALLDQELPEFVEEPVKPSGPPRPKHRAGAMWAAGLSVSAKGLGGRPQLGKALRLHHADTETTPRNVSSQPPTSKSRLPPATTTAKIPFRALTTPAAPSPAMADSPVPVVKTFSQIMAEKRRKQLQAQDRNDPDDNTTTTTTSLDSIHLEFSNSNNSNNNRNNSNNNRATPSSPSSWSRVSSRGEDEDDDDKEPRPKAPITPIIFGTMNKRKTEHRLRIKPLMSTGLSTKPLSTSSLSSLSSSHPSVPSHKRTETAPTLTSSLQLKAQAIPPPPMSAIRPSYKTARANKLLKKTTNATTDSLASGPVPAYATEMTMSLSSSSSSQRKNTPSFPPASSLPSLSPPPPSSFLPAVDKFTSSTHATTISTTTTTPGIKPQRRTSTTHESHNNRKSLSLDDDEFGFLDDDGGGVEDIGAIVGGHGDDGGMEPIDDLLQDIDDLLA